ncbi:EcsC family protein [Tropicibacter alexandrii]|uniref:EcsC family protein n=1 Tax=Tropicibacter alexandrii TaxID=2267683 RepID=UPI000EF54BD2|nr:EcsC family protein [Tropicibacter alexandrii]
MTDLTTIPPSVDLELAELARRHRAASSVGMQVLNYVGGRAEGLLDKLPGPVRSGLDDATARALELALSSARRSREVVPDQKPWLTTALATAMGAAGGVGGLPSALAELPVTVTVLFRAIQAVAAEYGFDPDDPQIARECLTVFSSAGPLAEDDGAEMAFLSARVTLTGATVHGLIARIAPRLATVLGQKLAAQAVPLLGAAAGAATNYAYTSYYQNMAHVHFGLLRLSEQSGRDRVTLVAELKDQIEVSRKKKRIR